MQMGNHRALTCGRNDFHLITEVLLPPKPTWFTEAKTEKPSVGTERSVWIQNGCRPLLCEVRSPHKFVFRVAWWGHFWLHFWAFLLLKTSKPEVYWRHTCQSNCEGIFHPTHFSISYFLLNYLLDDSVPLFCFHCHVLYVPAETSHWYLVFPQLYRGVLDRQQCSGRSMSTWHQHEWHSYSTWKCRQLYALTCWQLLADSHPERLWTCQCSKTDLKTGLYHKHEENTTGHLLRLLCQREWCTTSPELKGKQVSETRTDVVHQDTAVVIYRCLSHWSLF